MTVFLNGHGIPERGPLGDPIVDDSFLLLFNPLGEAVPFTLPDRVYGKTWETVVDTADPMRVSRKRVTKAGGRLDVGGHTLVVLRCRY
jgi:glycogen operon protein